MLGEHDDLITACGDAAVAVEPQMRRKRNRYEMITDLDAGPEDLQATATGPLALITAPTAVALTQRYIIGDPAVRCR